MSKFYLNIECSTSVQIIVLSTVLSLSLHFSCFCLGCVYAGSLVLLRLDHHSLLSLVLSFIFLIFLLSVFCLTYFSFSPLLHPLSVSSSLTISVSFPPLLHPLSVSSSLTFSVSFPRLLHPLLPSSPSPFYFLLSSPIPPFSSPLPPSLPV